MKFLDIFNEIVKGDFGLTDEAIYKSLQNEGELIPIWGGNQTHEFCDRMVSENAKTKRGDPITVFSGSGIIISLDGSAGSMTYKSGIRFALNHHAGFFTVKESTIDIIDPQFFAVFYQNELKATSVSDGSKTLSLEQIYQMDFEIPPFTVQKRIMELVGPLLNKRNQIDTILNNINSLFSKTISVID